MPIRRKADNKVLKRNRIRRFDAAHVLDVLRRSPVQVAAGTAEAASGHVATLIARIRLVNCQLKEASPARRPDPPPHPEWGDWARAEEAAWRGDPRILAGSGKDRPDAGTAGEMISRDVLMGLIGTNLDKKKHLEILKRMRLPDGRPDEVAQRRYIQERLEPTTLPRSKREQLQRIGEFLMQPPFAAASGTPSCRNWSYPIGAMVTQKHAVARILGDGERQRTRVFTELQSHYLFEKQKDC